MKLPIVSKTTLLICALGALLGSGVLSATPQSDDDSENLRQRAQQLLADSLCGPDPVLIQARARAARRLFAQAGDPLGEGLSLLAVGSTEVIDGNFSAGQLAFDRAVEVVTASADVLGIAMVRMVEAAAWRSAQQYEKAESSLRQAMTALRELERDGAELSLESLRYFAPQQFSTEAVKQVEPLLELFKPVLMKNLQSWILLELAAVQREQGLHEDALQTLDQAQTVTEFHLRGVDPILVEKAEVEVALDRPARAHELYEAALPLARERGDLASQARILRGLADVHERGGEREKAAEYRERAAVLAPAEDPEP